MATTAVLVALVFTVGALAPTVSAQSRPAQKKTEQKKPAREKTKKPRKARKSPRKRSARGGIEMNFNNVEMSIFLSVMAEALRLPLTWDSNKIRGTITLISPRRFRQRDALRIFETVLSMHGLTTVQTPGSPLVQVVQTATASRLPSPTRPKGRAGRISFFRTRIISLKYADANQVRAALTPLMSKSAGLAVYAPANVLVLSDTATNIRRLLQIIRAMDIPSEDVTFTVVKLKFATANKLAPIVTNLSSALPTTAQPRSRQRRRPAGRVSPLAQRGQKSLKVVADERTNSLILVGNADLIKRVKEIIVLLDVQAEEITFAVLTLKFARAKNLAPIVSSLSGALPTDGTAKPGRRPARSTRRAQAQGSPEVKVVADERTNTLILVGEPGLIKRIIGIIGLLDIPAEKVIYSVLKLKFASAKRLEPIVLALSSALPAGQTEATGKPSSKPPQPRDSLGRFAPKAPAKDQPPAAASKDPRFKVIADERTNILILVGEPDLIKRITKIISVLDVQSERVIYVMLKLKFASAKVLEPIITSLSGALPADPSGAAGKPPAKSKSPAEAPKDTDFKVVADERTNTLILVGEPELIKRIRLLVTRLDIPSEKVTYVVLTLKFASAKSLEPIVSSLSSALPSQAPGAGGTPPAKGGTSVAGSSGAGLKAVADERTNKLILIGDPELILRIKDIIALLDVPAEEIQTLVLSLKYASAKKLEPLITSLSSALPTDSPPAGGKNGAKNGSTARLSRPTAFKAVADERTNTLILVGDRRLIRKFKDIISLLDVPGIVEEKGVKVITLEHADAIEMVKLLKDVDIKADTKGKSDAAAQAFSSPLSKLTITADKATNSIIIFGPAEVIETMVEMVTQLDVRRPQVYVEVLILEMTLEKSLQLGIRWQGAGRVGSGLVGGGFPNAAPQSLNTALAGGTGSVIGIVGNEISFGGESFTSFSGFIQAIQQDTDFNVLANPQLLTLNNQEAEINVSQVVPVSTRTVTNTNLQTTTEFEFKDVGIILSITPQITGKNKIRLIINQESSSIATQQTVQSQNQTAITTLKRKLKTMVVVDNDTTMAIGGLIQEQTVNTETKVPCLGDIPLFGWLFKTKGESLRKTNLIIFIRPRIIATLEDMDAATGRVRKRYDELRSPKVDADDILRKSFGLPEAPKPEDDETPPGEDKNKDKDKDAPPADAGGDN
ncbi:MAG: secretin N-terminal domain-containing protein [bacterium]